MSLELIFTSAERGLKPGTRGFTTVAMTQGMPVHCVQLCESLSGYVHAFDLNAPNYDRNPVAWSHYRMKCGGRQYSVLSRVASHPKDYTGRTNKIAHHMMLESPEETALLVPGPAALLAHPGLFQKQWAGDPRYLPARNRFQMKEETRSFKADMWERHGLKAEWAAIVARAVWQDPVIPVFLIFDPAQGHDPQALIADALRLLPPARRWAVTFCSYLTSLPAGAECHIRGCLAGSEAAFRATRMPNAVVFDLSAATRSGTDTLPAGDQRLAIAAATGKPPLWKEKADAPIGTPPKDGPQEPSVRTASGSSSSTAAKSRLGRPSRRIVAPPVDVGGRVMGSRPSGAKQQAVIAAIVILAIVVAIVGLQEIRARRAKPATEHSHSDPASKPLSGAGPLQPAAPSSDAEQPSTPDPVSGQTDTGRTKQLSIGHSPTGTQASADKRTDDVGLRSTSNRTSQYTSVEVPARNEAAQPQSTKIHKIVVIPSKSVLCPQGATFAGYDESRQRVLLSQEGQFIREGSKKVARYEEHRLSDFYLDAPPIIEVTTSTSVTYYANVNQRALYTTSCWSNGRTDICAIDDVGRMLHSVSNQIHIAWFIGQSNMTSRGGVSLNPDGTLAFGGLLDKVMNESRERLDEQQRQALADRQSRFGDFRSAMKTFVSKQKDYGEASNRFARAKDKRSKDNKRFEAETEKARKESDEAHDAWENAEGPMRKSADALLALWEDQSPHYDWKQITEALKEDKELGERMRSIRSDSTELKSGMQSIRMALKNGNGAALMKALSVITKGEIRFYADQLDQLMIQVNDAIGKCEQARHMIQSDRLRDRPADVRVEIRIGDSLLMQIQIRASL